MRFLNLGFWAKIALLFLLRSGRATAALSLMILTAVSALIFLSALAVGINDAMVRNAVRLYSGHISGFALPASMKRENLVLEGVADVLRRVSTRGMLSHDDRVEMITMIGINPYKEWNNTAIWAKIVEGRYLQSGERAIFLSQPLAERLRVQVGDTVGFRPGSKIDRIHLHVSGIYKTGIDRLDRGIAFCPEEVIPVETDTWSAAVFLKGGVDLESIMVEYRRQLPESNHFKSWGDLMPDLRQLIDLEYLSMGIVTVLVFGVVSMGIACAFVIFILKNLREYGIMRATGVTSREMTLLIVIEVTLMNLIASGIGILVGILSVFLVDSIGGIDLTAFTSHNRYFAVSGVIHPRLTAYSLFFPPALSFLFSLASSVWPALLVARKKPAEVLRIV